MLEEEKEEIIQTCLDLVKNGHVQNTGTAGNVSIRKRETGFIASTPTQIRYDKMKPDDIVVVDMEGKIVEKKKSNEPTSEILTHLEIYREIEEANAIIHSHPPYSIALSIHRDQIPTVSEANAYFFGSKVPVIEYVTAWSENMAKETTECLKKYPGVIIRFHGLIVQGRNLDQTIRRTLEVENNSEIYYKALCLGEPQSMPQSEIDFLREQYKSKK